MGRNKDLIKNTAFVFIGNVGSKLMSFIMLPLYTRWLPPDAYGITDIITTYALLLLNVVAFDISDAIFVFPVGATEENIKKYYSTGFFFQIICSIVYFLIFFTLSLIENHSLFFEYIWYIYGILISNLFQKYTQDFCRGIKKMTVFSYTGIIQSASLAFLSIILIPNFGVAGFVIASISANTLTGMFTFLYSKSHLYLGIKYFSFDSLKEMLVYSIPLIPTAIIWWLINSLNRPLLESHVGVFAIGLFAVANKLPTLINLLFSFFQQAWIVTVIEEFKKDDFGDYYNNMFKMIFSVQLLGCIIIAICSKLFLSIMTTSEYYSAWVYIPIISISVLFSNTSAFCGTVFTACRKSKYIFYSVIIGGLMAIAANFLLIPLYGLMGACFSICISHICSALSRIIMSSKIVKFQNCNYVFIQLLIFTTTYIGLLSTNILIKMILYLTSLTLYFYTNRNIIASVYYIIEKSINKKICKK